MTSRRLLTSSPAGDAAPTAVIDLGRERSLTRLSAIYAAQPGSVEFYVLPSLPLEDRPPPTFSKSRMLDQVRNFRLR